MCFFFFFFFFFFFCCVCLFEACHLGNTRKVPKGTLGCKPNESGTAKNAAINGLEAAKPPKLGMLAHTKPPVWRRRRNVAVANATAPMESAPRAKPVQTAK
eukprot:NODE_951_length_1298_cov_381.781175.p5 GENE.NODE_951_length_1298_cov_381.781175~~NODE_951_length_1298_cov_381.781175.p5  ORF type:complete len:115 (-),score=86.70 NODE_951_length_1298_cov_381.781175:923-1225(-)